MLHRTHAVNAATALMTATTALVLAVALATPAYAAPTGATPRSTTPTCSTRPSVAGLDSVTYADRLVRAWGPIDWSDNLVRAWGRGDRTQTAYYATPDVVHTLFAFASPGGGGWQRSDLRAPRGLFT